MNTRLKKITAVVMLAVLPATLANAGLQDALEGMWMANTTAPTVYESSTRTGLYGGSMVLRNPVKTYQVFYFDPPRFNVGCNGVDMFFGAFSFISMEQLTQLIRNIAQVAVPYFFELALQQMCGPCNTILSKLRDLANRMNSGQLNACKLGKGLAADLASKTFGTNGNAKAQEEAEGFETALGNVGDWFKGVLDVSASPKDKLIEHAADIAAGGNLTAPRPSNATTSGKPRASIGLRSITI